MKINRRDFLKKFFGAIGVVFAGSFLADSFFKLFGRKGFAPLGIAVASPAPSASSGIEIAFGNRPLVLPYLGDSVQVLKPNSYDALPDVNRAMDEALNEPIGMDELFKDIKPEDKIAVCISDSTRSFDQPSMVKALLRFLADQKKHSAKNITFIIGNGNHAVLPVEKLGLGPEIERTCQFVNVNGADKNSFIKMGRTRPPDKYFAKVMGWETSSALLDAPRSILSALRDVAFLDFDHLSRNSSGGPLLRVLMSSISNGGTEIWMDRRVAEADWVVALGQIKPHPLAGYSGGAKAVLPGATSRLTTVQNHLLQAHPSADIGKVDDNILRLNIEEAARMLKKIVMFNVVLNGEGKPARFVAGDIVKAHREGVKTARKVCEVAAKRTPLVIVANDTQGKLDLYQFSKSTAPATCAVSAGGVVILCGELPGGTGENMAVNSSFAIKEVEYQFGLKRKMPKGVDFFCVSPNAKRATQGTFYHPFESIDNALSAAWKKLGRYSPATVIPNTDFIIPIPQS
ncbi:MAG: lactate racemase domain-containing protein [Candidatus Omnitrophica bacterium]|nr:lactate racemase domain-containing protein [Candidatus Omnitrophota bacterium]